MVRRTEAEIQAIDEAILEILLVDQPMSLRHLFYRLVVLGIPKTENAYKGVGRRLLLLRRSGLVPQEWIVDNTRRPLVPMMWDSVSQMLSVMAEAYRENMWNRQSDHVQVWCESDSVGGVLAEITMKHGVSLMVCRGFASETFLVQACEELRSQVKPVFIYYFGDHDPSGMWIPRKVEERIREVLPRLDLEFTRVAVNENQIEEYDLPTRPPKKSDSRTKNFVGDTVEIEALDVSVLREMCEARIEEHVSPSVRSQVKSSEKTGRNFLKDLAEDAEGRGY